MDARHARCFWEARMSRSEQAASLSSSNKPTVSSDPPGSLELNCVAIVDGRMAASRADVMVSSMAACVLRELDDEVDEDRA